MRDLVRAREGPILFVRKAEQGKADEINTCIGCNQACLDHTFAGKITSCLVNPRACHETLLKVTPSPTRHRIAVVGAGPAGLSFATTAAQRGFEVTLFDAASAIGGQFNIAKKVPGKDRGIAFQNSVKSLWRYVSSHPARLNFPRREPLDPSFCMALSAI